MIGRKEEKNLIFLIDFGLAKNFLKKDGTHIPFQNNVGLIGTTRYTSIQSHLGNEQSRKDDLESLGYCLIYLFNGTLPWIDLKQLCKGMPFEFNKYMIYVKNLSFTEEPNYNFIKNLFRVLFLELKYEYDDKFDWIIQDYKNISSEDKQCMHNLEITGKFVRRKFEENIMKNDDENIMQNDEEEKKIDENMKQKRFQQF
ncbi:hypothetical protein IMG5_005080 [Ichthyophthirius multifiliis]|uniref:Casein kinase I n=1 Tax=Ichthyophthirius multifiliis TaxID=5932 RepID=G0QJF5_ICHMU|nr:hypothetical protein IMG5_005080 [Ichthyophthirius multifiliis]EGR34642.1 hypothetical protein IMG5_005080 [Ichthyophthirius multifiliis]|eukprot:XP_004039946.1 hypothetical protein IMG5_005080 [Ichthyophthirius multifiliis]